jgi:hypothetical protein
MINLYVLDLEDTDQSFTDIPDKVFIEKGTKYSIEKFEYAINSGLVDINLDKVFIKFIEDKPKDSIEIVGPVWNDGFTIDFVENPLIQKGRGVLLLNPENMPKNE